VGGSHSPYHLGSTPTPPPNQRGNMGKWDVNLDRSVGGDFILTIACHEAAHAVVGQERGAWVEYARVASEQEMYDRGLGGEVSYADKMAPLLFADREMVTGLAGVAFDQLLSEGNCKRKGNPRNMLNDRNNALRYARALHENDVRHGREGYSVRQIMGDCLEVARQAVVENWDVIIALGRELARLGTMDGDEVRKFVAEYKRSTAAAANAGAAQEETMLRDFSEEGQKQILSMLAETCPEGCHWSMTPGQEYLAMLGTLERRDDWKAEVAKLRSLEGTPAAEYNEQVFRLHQLWDEVRYGLGLSVCYTDPADAERGEFNLDFENEYDRLFRAHKSAAIGDGADSVEARRHAHEKALAEVDEASMDGRDGLRLG